MLLIYTANNTNRFSYIAEVLFWQVYKIDFTITQNKEELLQYEGAKINYSGTPVCAKEIWIQPHDLLLQQNIQPQNIECFNWNGIKAFFKTVGDIPFDIFAASFYLISRYEEYLPHETDEYGRYAHANSMAFKEGFLHVPLVNLWMKELVKIIHSKYSSFTFHLPPFTFTPTYDVDIAYAYKGKGFLRNAGGFYKELFTGKFKQLAERSNVTSGWQKDPFDTYEWIDSLHEKYHLKPIYFFLLAERARMYDKNISPHSRIMQRLIKQHALKYTTGIHPSWQSSDDEGIFKKEISLLKSITGKEVKCSRQHYIRMSLPQTYRLLLENCIEADYTMGYGSINGFRASVASPFYWFDIELDVKTGLFIYPYCYMEANSYFEQHYTAEQAAVELQQYLNRVKSVGGQLITIFHNHFITEQPEWLPWRNMYAGFLQNNF